MFREILDDAYNEKEQMTETSLREQLTASKR